MPSHEHFAICICQFALCNPPHHVGQARPGDRSSPVNAALAKVFETTTRFVPKHRRGRHVRHGLRAIANCKVDIANWQVLTGGITLAETRTFCNLHLSICTLQSTPPRRPDPAWRSLFVGKRRSRESVRKDDSLCSKASARSPCETWPTGNCKLQSGHCKLAIADRRNHACRNTNIFAICSCQLALCNPPHHVGQAPPGVRSSSAHAALAKAFERTTRFVSKHRRSRHVRHGLRAIANCEMDIANWQLPTGGITLA